MDDHERNGINISDHQQGEKLEEVVLPGFRFHPTDEELVGFYLKRKIQQRPLSIELIKQLDIYKFDPWDLPKLATTGEKEWYFYCPRDRKYRNSARPNRVTGAGFWKATGTDRPIYSSEGSKCIGLKKSLVFYKGRAAKGVKTDWMMHEFRLPTLSPDPSSSPKRFLHKNLPSNDSWAICRIFKKTNSTAQRALSHSWVSPPMPDQTTSPSNHQLPNGDSTNNTTHHPPPILLNPNPNIHDLHHISAAPHALDFSSYKLINHLSLLNSPGDLASLIFANMSSSSSSSPMPSAVDFGGSPREHCNSGSVDGSLISSSVALTHDEILQRSESSLTADLNLKHLQHDQWDAVRSNAGFPFGFPVGLGDSWKPNMMWDS